MKPWYYTQESDGRYLLHDDRDRVQTAHYGVAIAFDSDNYSLLKHGDPEKVNAWVVDYRKQLKDQGLGDIANSLCVIESSEWDLEELNKALSTSGYMQFILKNLPRSGKGTFPTGLLRLVPKEK
jgi:hypothetical protein